MGRGQAYDVLTARRRLKMTQEELALLLETTTKSVRRWERGYNKPTRFTIARIEGLLEARVIGYKPLKKTLRSKSSLTDTRL